MDHYDKTVRAVRIKLIETLLWVEFEKYLIYNPAALKKFYWEIDDVAERF